MKINKICFVVLALLFSAPAAAEKIVQITIAGIYGQNDISKVSLATSYKVLRTGEATITDTPDIDLDVKTGLGLYKTALQLNQDLREAIYDHIESTYSITTNNVDKVIYQGMFTDLGL